jgi:hypothetical protein
MHSLNYLIIETAACLHLFLIPGQTGKYCFLAIFLKPNKRETVSCTSKIALAKQNMFQSELFRSISWEAKLLS